jgi:hypothetical protein
MATRSRLNRFLPSLALTLCALAAFAFLIRRRPHPGAPIQHVSATFHAPLPRLDFGEVRPDRALRTVATWTNLSDRLVNVVGTETDCACLTVQARQLEIPPGATLELDGEFDPPANSGVLEVAYQVTLDSGEVLRGLAMALVLAPPTSQQNVVVQVSPSDTTWTATAVLRLPWKPGAATIRPEPLNPELVVTLSAERWTGTDTEIDATIRGGIDPTWHSPVAQASDDWRESVEFHVEHPDASVRLRTRITLVRTDALSVSPRRLLLRAGERGCLTLQSSAETMGCEPVAVTNPPRSAVVEALDGGRFAVTTIAGADAVFDVVIVCGEASTRVPVVAIGEER